MRILKAIAALFRKPQPAPAPVQRAPQFENLSLEELRAKVRQAEGWEASPGWIARHAPDSMDSETEYGSQD